MKNLSENFDLKKKKRNCEEFSTFAYLRSAIIHKDLIVQGVL
jgi:hypothetical protein